MANSSHAGFHFWCGVCGLSRWHPCLACHPLATRAGSAKPRFGSQKSKQKSPATVSRHPLCTSRIHSTSLHLNHLVPIKRTRIEKQGSFCIISMYSHMIHKCYQHPVVSHTWPKRKKQKSNEFLYIQNILSWSSTQGGQIRTKSEQRLWWLDGRRAEDKKSRYFCAAASQSPTRVGNVEQLSHKRGNHNQTWSNF